MLVDEACEVRVHALVSTDQLIRIGQTWHKSSLFEPENCTETAREENTLHASKSDNSFRKRVVCSDPPESPLGFLGNGVNILDSLQKELLFGFILDISINEKTVSLRMDILHGHLEPVKAPRLWDLDLRHEPLSQVLQDDTVGGSEKGEHVLDKVLLTLVKLVPIFQILAQIDLLGGPEASHLVLVHLPYVVVLNRKDDESVGILIKDWLGVSLTQALGLDLGLRLLGGARNLLLGASMLTVVIVDEL